MEARRETTGLKLLGWALEVVGIALVAIGGWVKGGGDDPGMALALFIGGAVIWVFGELLRRGAVRRNTRGTSS